MSPLTIHIAPTVSGGWLVTGIGPYIPNAEDKEFIPFVVRFSLWISCKIVSSKEILERPWLVVVEADTPPVTDYITRYFEGGRWDRVPAYEWIDQAAWDAWMGANK